MMRVVSNLYLLLFIAPINRAFTTVAIWKQKHGASSNTLSLGSLMKSNDADEEGQKQKQQDEDEQKQSTTTTTSSSSTLDVIQQCMASSSSAPEPDGLITRRLQQGISGFAVDKDLGFCCILTDEKQQQCTFVVVSTTDKSGELRSPEALCMVQLAGGMDLGTPIFPPDCLARVVVEELDDDDDDENLSSEEIRPRLELLEIHAVPSEESKEESNTDDDDVSGKAEATTAAVSSSPERTTKLMSDLPKLSTSLKTLPGLQDCTEDQVLDAMEKHADEEGKIDRIRFTAILDTLRRDSADAAAKHNNRIRFELVVSLDGNRLADDRRVPVPSVIQALGLAMRYKKEVQISKNCIMDIPAEELVSRFPLFQPLQGLEEDARMMENFIPSMFAKATAPKADDRA